MDDPTKRASLRVLVVDDCPDTVESMVRLLNMWGYDAVPAQDGLAVLRTAQSYRPDVILLDLGLPGLDGYEVARRVRQDPALAGAGLICVTGYVGQSHRSKASEAGFDEFLAKPVDLSELRLLLDGRAKQRCK
jgi:two-component system CheB/CheR fusion protein